MASYTLGEIAELTQSELIGDPQYQIYGVETLEAASPSEVAFLDNARYEKQLEATQAGAVIVHKNQKVHKDKNLLLNENPSLAFQIAIELFIKQPESGFSSIHPTAVIHSEAKLGSDVTVGPYSVIDRGVQIGNRTVISSGCFIGAQTLIGEDCLLYPNVTIREGCILKNRIVLQPGVVIGACGFGYHTDKKGKHHFLKQLGNVVIEDDVEIGANTTIDRSRFKTTLVRRGTKIDNLVQIGHGVEVGEDNMIVSQVGIAGSTKTGKNVVMGGQVGVSGHLTIADGAVLAARSGVSKSLLEKGCVYGGAPAAPIKEFGENLAQLRSIHKLYARVKELETKIASLEKESV